MKGKTNEVSHKVIVLPKILKAGNPNFDKQKANRSLRIAMIDGCQKEESCILPLYDDYLARSKDKTLGIDAETHFDTFTFLYSKSYEVFLATWVVVAVVSRSSIC